MFEKLEGQWQFSNGIPAIVVAILISTSSTLYFTDEQTGSMIIPALHWLFPCATPST
jgi:hypothetical protein